MTCGATRERETEICIKNVAKLKNVFVFFPSKNLLFVFACFIGNERYQFCFKILWILKNEGWFYFIFDADMLIKNGFQMHMFLLVMLGICFSFGYDDEASAEDPRYLRCYYDLNLRNLVSTNVSIICKFILIQKHDWMLFF